MVSTRALRAFGTFATLAQLVIADSGLLPRAPFEAFGILEDKEQTAANEYYAKFAPPSLLGEKNVTGQTLKDRSMALDERQSCNAGFGYCDALGICCPSTDLCCSYGYCIDPEDTCCPGDPCAPDWGCCGTNCYPKGGDCCKDYTYCEPGNMCVILGSTGEMVCCTDLQCTAAVVSGTTSYVSVQETAAFSTPPVVSTPPDVSTTPPASITPAPTHTAQPSSFDGGFEYWYWTVTWWYLSFYWTVYQTSEVTWTTIYETTTFTTTATDRAQALSEFSVLSETLTFPVPPDAQTSLIYFITAQPSLTDDLPSATGFTFNPGAFSSNSVQLSEVVITKTAARPTTRSSSTTDSSASAATASGVTGAGIHAAQLGYVSLIGALAAVPGLLMVWL